MKTTHSKISMLAIAASTLIAGAAYAHICHVTVQWKCRDGMSEIAEDPNCGHDGEYYEREGKSTKCGPNVGVNGFEDRDSGTGPCEYVSGWIHTHPDCTTTSYPSSEGSVQKDTAGGPECDHSHGGG